MNNETKDQRQVSNDEETRANEVTRLTGERQWAKAIEVALSPDHGPIQDHRTCWNVGWAYFKLEQFIEAKKYLTQASHILRNASTMWALGVVHKELGQLETAEDNLREALAVKESSLARAELALTLMEQGRRGEAEQVHMEGLRLNPQSQSNHLSYAGFLIDEWRMDEARRTYEKAELLSVQGRYKKDRDSLLTLAGSEVKATLSDALCVGSPEVRWSEYPISISHEGRIEVFPDGVGAAERILLAGYLYEPRKTLPELVEIIVSFFGRTIDEPAYFIDCGNSFDDQSPAFKVPFKWGVSQVDALFRIRCQGIALVGSSFENGLILRSLPASHLGGVAQFEAGLWTCNSPNWKSALEATLAANSHET